MTAGDAPPTPQSWPPGRDLAAAETTIAACRGCNTPWRVHASLAGFRLRCHCGAWVEVPAPACPLPAALPAPPATLSAPAGPPSTIAAARERGLVALPAEPGETLFAPIPTDLPLAPGALRAASPSNRARWTDRTLLELAAMLAALLLPPLLAWWLSSGREFELLLPLASLVSGALVALVAAWAGPYGRLGFTRAAPRHFAEGMLAAGAGLLLATGWVAVLRVALGDAPDPLAGMRARLGLPITLFVVAAAPAVLEEIVFRGLLQGRLLALLGERVGLIATAAAFALCHGMPAVLPIHFGLGLYLGWLRRRAGSLLPGMLTHFVYNGAVVALGVG